MVWRYCTRRRSITMKKTLAILLLLAGTFAFARPGAESATKRPVSIAVFVPGVIAGSPVYQMLAEGATEAVETYRAAGNTAELTIIEAGTRQADWENRLTALVAGGRYDLVVTSNPAMPDIAAAVSSRFPGQKFLVLDAHYTGNKQITTYRYNQREQGYLAGFMSALVSSSAMPNAQTGRKIGLIAGQEYPAMTDVILPAYREGARAVDPAFTVDFRVVGNWYDAAKGAELARAMKNAGADVIMPISGGANQGVLSAARETGFYVAWFDDNGYSLAPGLVIASSIMDQRRLTAEKVLAYLEGSLPQGEAGTVGFADGYIRFVDDDPLWVQTVPESLRRRMLNEIRRLQNGELILSIQ